MIGHLLPILPRISSLDDTLRMLSIPAWLVCIGCQVPAVYRVLRWRSRYLDPILVVVFLLGLNRLSFLFRVSAEVSHATALILALAMGAGSAWYQKHDQ